MFGFLSQPATKKIAGLIMVSLFLFELVVGGVILPYMENQRAQAIFADYIGGFAGIGNFFEGLAADAAEMASDAWEGAGVWAETYLKIDEGVQKAIKEALIVAFTAFKKKLLDMMADQIITWINGGGKPAFVTDWRAFLSKAVNDVGGNFVSEYLGAGFLCKNISPQVQLMLAKPPTFDTAAACTLSDIGANIQNFYNNFNSGGWKGWLTISETQNNIYGMYFYAQDQKWGAEQLAAMTGSQAAQSAAGFLGDQVCLRYYKMSSGGKPIDSRYPNPKDAPKKGEAPAPFTDANCTEWYTRTPGKVAADSLSKITNGQYDWLLLSKEYGEYVVAIADAVINRTIKEGVLLLMPAQTDTSGGGFTIDYSTVMAGVADYKNAAENKPYIEQIIPQEKLLKENLRKIITEYQTNLNILNQIRTVQSDAFNTLKEISQNSCSLPGGAIQQNLGTQTTSNCGANICPCTSKTVETIKVNAPSFGEATFQATTLEEFSFNTDDRSCSDVTTTKTASTTLGSLSTDADFSAINAAISKIQSQTSQIDAAVADMQNYQKTIEDYIAAYDATQGRLGSQAGNAKVATSTISAMYDAKQKAIDSTKNLLGSSSTKIKDLVTEVMDASKNTANQKIDLIQKRGNDTSNAGMGCSYNTGYYKTLCDIQAIKTSWDSALASCRAD
ncbi:MAG: hypothetical protein PHT44_01500 [Candidatus Portnoybacteria bacterium]|nr:hypothetical protein [Candidatus Portnoybacteria bacterium]MDD4982730.1 hypothetical protein [Candidatus Portnoybacteria bacterium]